MPRRRSYLERPHDHLVKAAARSAAIAAGTPHESELEAGDQAEHEPTPSEARARKARRDKGGRFK